MNKSNGHGVKEKANNGQRKEQTMSEKNNGRDAKGRFVKGNSGGPGNPFARQMAAFRQKLMDVIEPQDFEAIAFQLMMLARGGNMDAIKLLFAYIMGKPTQTVHPDMVDHMELAMLKNAGTTAEGIEEALDCMPVKDAVEYARMPKEEFIQRQIVKNEERKQRRAERRLRKMETRRFREEQLRPEYTSIEEELGLMAEPAEQSIEITEENLPAAILAAYKAKLNEMYDPSVANGVNGGGEMKG